VTLLRSCLVPLVARCAPAPMRVAPVVFALAVMALSSSTWAQSAGPPDAATAPPGEIPAQPPPEIPPAPPDAPPPAEVEAAAEATAPAATNEASAAAEATSSTPAAPSVIGLDFLGLWAGPDEADVGFTVEERVREALARPPFALNDGPSSPIAPACLQDPTCKTEKLGGRVERWVVAGSLSGEATRLTLTLVLLAPSSGAQIARASVTETSNDDGRARLLQSVPPVVNALLQSLDPAAGPAVPAEVALAASPVEEDEVDEPVPVPEDETRSRLWQEEEEVVKEEDKRKLTAKTNPPVTKAPAEASANVNYGAWIWSGSFLGVGALMALGGVGFDLFSPTSVDDELGLPDAVGPGLVLAGATVALVGLAVNPFLWMALSEEEGEADAQP
jgi:hypothetical protein